MKNLLAGAVAFVILSPWAVYAQPSPAPQALPDTPSQQQAIPDAPKPQTTFGAVTPGAGTTSTNSGVPAAPVPPAATPVPSSLPANVTPTEAVRDAGDQPEIAAKGEGSQLLKDNETPTLRLHVNFVEVPFTVKDNKGHLVAGITWRDVRVYENGVRQRPVVFIDDPVPMSAAVVIDQSLPYQVMNSVNNALEALQGAFAPYDEVAVFTYNNGPRMQTEFTAAQSARLAAVLEYSKSSGREGAMAYTSGPLSQNININSGDANNSFNPLVNSTHGTSMSGVLNAPREVHTLNDAILEAAKAVSKAAKGRRRVIYVISDGKEYGSTAKTKDVIKYLQTNNIAVYATLVGDSSVAGLGFIDRIHLPLQMRDNILPTYTSATGGEFYADYRTKGIENSFAKIAEEIRTQYIIGYNSAEPMIDGKFRTIEVKVERPNLDVIAKKGYFPNAAEYVPPSASPQSAPAATPAP